MGVPAILDAGGRPMRRQSSRASALAGGERYGGIPYDAADQFGEHTATWQPWLLSPDVELNPYRDQIVARARDVARNDGWASGGITRILDNAIGATFRPISKPDHRALAAYTGSAKFDAIWADEFARALDSHWRTWADDHVGKYCDLQRSSWMGLLFGVAFRHLLIDNDALALMHWRPERVGPGRATFGTAVQLVDPDRLSNPRYLFDQRHLRGGVEVDEDNVAIAYHIRKAHQGDWFMGADQVDWERVPRETEWGRPMVVHYFEPDRSSMHRGGNGVFTPVLQRIKMLFRYDVAELDAALLNAIMAAIAESPFDHQLLAQALGDETGDPDEAAAAVSAYQQDRTEFHRGGRLAIGKTKVIPTYPGEKLQMLRAERPNPNFAAFEKAVLRNIGQALGVTSQWISGDYSDTNYSSMRAALLDAWKTIHRRRHNFGAGFGSPIRAALIEEIMAVADLPLPAGAPAFIECRQAYSRCKWMGPGRGWVDPVAEKQGALLGMDGCLSTLEHEVAEGSGEYYEDVLDQRQVEQAAIERRGLALPQAYLGLPAAQNTKKPDAD